ncbi:hypothetical protein B0T40_13440 [Chromobacterium haemolyticum]|nr:hypothetical protein B0T40_13440 [Chromobacterium haemolyticum]
MDEIASCLRDVSMELLSQIMRLGNLQIERNPYVDRLDHYLFVTEGAFFSITLEYNKRRVKLPVVWQYGSALTTSPYASWQYPREFLYSLPLASAEWPDNTHVIFEPMVEP